MEYVNPQTVVGGILIWVVLCILLCVKLKTDDPFGDGLTVAVVFPFSMVGIILVGMALFGMFN